jgi:hypothetical protein
MKNCLQLIWESESTGNSWHPQYNEPAVKEDFFFRVECKNALDAYASELYLGFNIFQSTQNGIRARDKALRPIHKFYNAVMEKSSCGHQLVHCTELMNNFMESLDLLLHISTLNEGSIVRMSEVDMLPCYLAKLRYKPLRNPNGAITTEEICSLLRCKPADINMEQRTILKKFRTDPHLSPLLKEGI